jgi:hypothetical protein
MSKIFSGLTNPNSGVTVGGHDLGAFNGPEQATRAASDISLPELSAGARIKGDVLSPQVTTANPDDVAQLKTPSFKQASLDGAGNVKPLPGALTKKGKLFSLIFGAAQGGADAVSSGALDAVPGRSNFGAGMAGATQMPIFRRQQAAAAERSGLENKLLGEQVDLYPTSARLDIAKTRAGIDKDAAEGEYYRKRGGSYDKPHVVGNPSEGVGTVDADGNYREVAPPKKTASGPKTAVELQTAIETEKDPVLKQAYANSLKAIQGFQMKRDSANHSVADKNASRLLDHEQLQNDGAARAAAALASSGNDTKAAMAKLATAINSGKLNPYERAVAGHAMMKLRGNPNQNSIGALLGAFMGGNAPAPSAAPDEE